MLNKNFIIVDGDQALIAKILAKPRYIKAHAVLMSYMPLVAYFFCYVAFNYFFFPYQNIRILAALAVVVSGLMCFWVAVEAKLNPYVFLIGIFLLLLFLIMSLTVGLYENPLLILMFYFLVYIFYQVGLTRIHIIHRNFATGLVILVVVLLIFMSLEMTDRWWGGGDSILGELERGSTSDRYRLSGNTYNPNRWAASISVLVYTLMAFSLRHKSKAITIAFLGFFSYGLLSMSKAFLFSSLITFLIMVIISSSYKKAVKAGVCFLILFLGILFFIEIPGDVIRKISTQAKILESPLVDDTIQARLESYMAAMNALSNNWVFGVGVEGLEISPHNNFLAHIAYFGIPGFLIYVLVYLAPLVVLISNTSDKKSRNLLICMAIGVVISSFASSLATDTAAQSMYAVCLLISLICIRYSNDLVFRERHQYIYTSKNGVYETTR